MRKIASNLCCLFTGLLFSLIAAEETTPPSDPFSNLEVEKTADDYASSVDRSRGSFFLDAKDGQYSPGDHFAHWNWTATPSRWGKYYVGIRYVSNRTKLGVQIKVGDLPPVKSYAARTGKDQVGTMVLGTIYIPKAQQYPVMLLTGDQSNVPAFTVKGIEFTPAPEGETLGQSIDGTINLFAKSATTYAEQMRFEPNDKQNCLSHWSNEKDWAEWSFDVSSPGEFEVGVVCGCGAGSGGSAVEVLVDGETLVFKVEETGSFQTLEAAPVGKVNISLAGMHKLAIRPVSKTGEAVMDLQKVVLTPVAN